MFCVLRILAVLAALGACAVPVAAQDHESHGDAAATDSPFRGITARGFSDFTFRADSTDSSAGRRTAASFALGQFSLFLSAPIANNVSIVTETAFKLGSDNRQSQSIELERVYIKYTVSDAVRFAFGRTHTALGYWNEAYHHGALLHPTVARPEILRFGGVMPLHAVGLEVTGRLPAGKGWDISYMGNLANGRSREFSATQGAADMDRGKAAAVKMSVTHESQVSTVVFGPMFYRDTIPPDPSRAGRSAAVTETIPGLHFVLRLPGYEMLSEYFSLRHDQASTATTFRHAGWYAIAVGRFDSPVKPYAGIDVTEFDSQDPYFAGGNTSVRRILGGVRFDVSSTNAIKVEYRRERRAAGETHAVLFNTAFAF